jgi:hypothetical protein
VEPPTPSIPVQIQQILVLVRLVPPERPLEVEELLDRSTTSILLVALPFMAGEGKVDVFVHQREGANVALDEALHSSWRLDSFA